MSINQYIKEYYNLELYANIYFIHFCYIIINNGNQSNEFHDTTDMWGKQVF